jgi:hypothetical protein
MGDSKYASEKKLTVFFIPTTKREIREFTKFSINLDGDKAAIKSISSAVDYFNVHFIYNPFLFGADREEIEDIKEKAKDTHLVVFMYDTSKSPKSNYHKKFIRNVSEFKPPNGSKTYFALYLPEGEGYIPSIKQPLIPNALVLGSNVPETVGNSLVKAYGELRRA